MCNLLKVIPPDFQCNRVFNKENYSKNTVAKMRTKFNEIINKVKTLFIDGFCPLNTDFEDLERRTEICDIPIGLNSIYEAYQMAPCVKSKILVLTTVPV